MAMEMLIHFVLAVYSWWISRSGVLGPSKEVASDCRSFHNYSQLAFLNYFSPASNLMFLRKDSVLHIWGNSMYFLLSG